MLNRDNDDMRMTMKINEFLDLMCKALDRDAGTLTLEDTPQTVEQWDSVGHLMIITAITKLGVATDGEEFERISSLGDLATVLKAHGDLEE